MEKINIAELLKNCPKGMELDCAMYDNVTFIQVLEEHLYPIVINTPEGQISLNKYGCCSNNKLSKCIIFPKDKTTWEGFIPPCKLKDGDIISNGKCICVYNGNENDKYFGLYVGVGHALGPNYFVEAPRDNYFKKEHTHFATEEEKAKLFNAIKENGYRWNAETKTLEKLIKPKFKVGDKIKNKLTSHLRLVF